MNIVICGDYQLIGYNFLYNFSHKYKITIADDIDNMFLYNEFNYIIYFSHLTKNTNISSNINRTYKLLENIKIYNPYIPIIYFSIDEIYGLYEKGNYSSINYEEIMIKSYKLNSIIARCNNIYGEGLTYNNIVSSYILNSLNNNEIIIMQNDKTLYDFIHIDDILKVIDIIITKGIIGEIYNIDNNNPINLVDLANLIINKTKSGHIKFIDNTIDNYIHKCIEIKNIKDLQWKPEVVFTEGIYKLIKWIKKDIYYQEKKYIDLFGTSRLLKVPDNKILEEFIYNNNKNYLYGINVMPYARHVYCINGSILNYIINLKNNIYTKQYITSDKINYVYIPADYGHLYIALEDNTQLLHKNEGIYNPLYEKKYNYLCPYINLDIKFNNNYIVNAKDKQNPFYKNIDYIIIDNNTYLGREISKYINNTIFLSFSIDNIEIFKKQLIYYKTKYIIYTNYAFNNNKNAITYALLLAEICDELNIHLTIFTTDFLQYNTKNEINENPTSLLEICLKDYKNILILRLGYCITLDDNKICILNDATNLNDMFINITIIPDLFYHLSFIIEKNTIGILNFANKNNIKISHLIDFMKIRKYNIIPNNDIQYGLFNTNKLNSLIKLNGIKEALSIYRRFL